MAAIHSFPTITDYRAASIAAHWHASMGCPLYVFQSTGAIPPTLLPTIDKVRLTTDSRLHHEELAKLARYVTRRTKNNDTSPRPIGAWLTPATATALRT